MTRRDTPVIRVVLLEALQGMSCAQVGLTFFPPRYATWVTGGRPSTSFEFVLAYGHHSGETCAFAPEGVVVSPRLLCGMRRVWRGGERDGCVDELLTLES